MDYSIVVISLLLALSTSVNGQSTAPAPVPAPEYTNLTELLSVAGPFHTFLDYLVSTKVIDTFQEQANNTEEGITFLYLKTQPFLNSKNRLFRISQVINSSPFAFSMHCHITIV
ncbi:hypothetical protein RDI58_029556 [Solanum bulbocastanum]|uniref:Uncharacterized protein n=1 Tax=Solanum bulbocastanum TaxID=147425 RepID=A0AAN8SX45_SOLBU